MKFPAILFIGATMALLCSCSTSKHYSDGRGDAGQFLLRHAIAYGGHPIQTNDLPTIEGKWQYIQDEYGVGILLPPSQYQSVEDFVRVAFGPPSDSAGWKVRDFGVAIGVQKDAKNTVVGLYPPMSDEKFGRGLLETIDKGTK